MIDEEIREALDVDPSPEFLARVRTRIAAEPAPPTWRWSWTVAAAAALAAMVMIGVVLSRPKQERPSAHDVAHAFPPSRATESDALPRTPTGSAPSPGAHTGRPAIAIPVVSHFSRTAPPASTEPEILIDQREMQTLRRLIDGVRSGRIDLTAAQNSRSHAPAEPEPVADIVIAPLTIEPIAPVSGAEGVRP